ncbi:MAG TPA: 50S ribosomal protein L28 [Candidatus Nanoarchaeia archaeon]
MRSCDRCGKGMQVGMNVSHSHVRTKKRSYPNLHNLKIKKGGITTRLRLCTKCLRIVKKEQKAKVGKTPTVAKETENLPV